MSKREYLRKLLANGRGADEIADLFGLTTEKLQAYLGEEERSRLALSQVKSDLKRLEEFPLDSLESILLFSFRVILESIGFLFVDLERDLYDSSNDRTSRLIKRLLDGAYLLLAINRLELVGAGIPALRKDTRFSRACQNKAFIPEKLLDIAERIERDLGGDL